MVAKSSKSAAKKSTSTPKKPAAKKPAAKKPAAKKPVAKKPAAKKPAAKKPVAKKPVAKKPAAKKPAAQKPAAERRTAKGFRINEFIVYPAHGVGQIIEISEHEIAGETLDLYVINFEKEKMVLRVPLEKAKQIGMRKLADKAMMDGAMRTLRGRARIKRTMWSRRAQEYEAKINSGDIIAISEVVRDLFRNENQPEQSYSERQLYEAALDRLAREVAAVEKSTEDEAKGKLESLLNKATSKAEKKAED
ncbi:MAG: CarD family transcriptional regulator [Parvibaculales bacterium]